MTVEFSIENAAAFSKAGELLAGIQNQPRTQNFAVAIALLLHRRTVGVSGAHRILHQPGDVSTLVSTADMQRRICDPTWEKVPEFLPGDKNSCIYKPFSNRFYPASNNNWRNSFDLQAGLSCDAPDTAEYLFNDKYLSEPRFYCEFRDPETASCNSPTGLTNSNRTCFNPNKRNAGQVPGPGTTARHLPKLLTRRHMVDAASGYWYIEPNVDVLTDLLSSAGDRIPLLPFLVALYGGSSYWRAKSEEVSEERFRTDLALDQERFLTLFDTDLGSPLNALVLPFAIGGGAGVVHALPVVRPDGTGVRELSAPSAFTPRGDVELARKAGEQSDPERRLRLLERATTAHRRTLNRLAAIFSDAGYSVDEQLDGYDLHAVRGTEEYLLEVKTWTEANLLKQIRSGWAQLYEYRYRNGFSPDITLCLVFDRPPPSNVWTWPWLAGELNVLPCWLDGDMLGTFAEFRDSLPNVLTVLKS